MKRLTLNLTRYVPYHLKTYTVFLTRYRQKKYW